MNYNSNITSPCNNGVESEVMGSISNRVYNFPPKKKICNGI